MVLSDLHLLIGLNLTNFQNIFFPLRKLLSHTEEAGLFMFILERKKTKFVSI